MREDFRGYLNNSLKPVTKKDEEVVTTNTETIQPEVEVVSQEEIQDLFGKDNEDIKKVTTYIKNRKVNENMSNLLNKTKSLLNLKESKEEYKQDEKIKETLLKKAELKRKIKELKKLNQTNSDEISKLQNELKNM